MDPSTRALRAHQHSTYELLLDPEAELTEPAFRLTPSTPSIPSARTSEDDQEHERTYAPSPLTTTKDNGAFLRRIMGGFGPTSSRAHDWLNEKSIDESDSPSLDSYCIKITLVLLAVLSLVLAAMLVGSADLTKIVRQRIGKHTSVVRLEISFQDLYPASKVIRPSALPFDESTIVLDNTTDPRFSAWCLSDDPSRLPVCKKIVTYRLEHIVGWGGSIHFLIRAATYAERLGAVLLVNNDNWIYGRYEYYFEPYTIDCVPPPAWYDETLATRIGSKGWEQADRIVMNFDDSEAMDDFEQRLFLDGEIDGLRRLYDLEFGGRTPPSVLPAPETLPPPMRSSFNAHANTVQRLWKPVPEIRADIERVKAMMGIGGEYPTIAVQVRLGDKVREFNASIDVVNVQNSFGNLTAHLEVMHDLYDRLIDSPSSPKPWYPLSSTARRFPRNKQPRAIVMTAEDDVLDKMASDPIASPFQYDRPPALNVPQPASFKQATFIQMGMESRVAHTRGLVRDLFIMAKEADAAVLTMGSNLGRLALLLGGADSALGPVDSEGEHVGGRMRALDTWFFFKPWAVQMWEAIGIQDDGHHHMIHPTRA